MNGDLSLLADPRLLYLLQRCNFRCLVNLYTMAGFVADKIFPSKASATPGTRQGLIIGLTCTERRRLQVQIPPIQLSPILHQAMLQEEGAG